MGAGRRRITAALAALAAAATAVVLPVTTAPAGAQSGEDVVEACDPATELPEAGPRACAGVQSFTWLAGQHCRRVPGAEGAACPATDGRRLDEAAVEAYEQSWTARALDLQRDLDLDAPLHQSLTIHTHNSANSAAYDPSLTSGDANQVLTITDQLRLGVRGIEIDLHWAPHPAGDPEQGGRAVVQCHGEPADGFVNTVRDELPEEIGDETPGELPDTPAGQVHVGCSVDQLFADLADELAEWLANADDDDFVLLYLENVLDGDPVAHDRAAAVLRESLGEDLVTVADVPSQDDDDEDECDDLPVTLSKRSILAHGRVLVTGNCGPDGSDWNGIVFERGPRWDESGTREPYVCAADRARRNFETDFIRHWDDSTFLTAMDGGERYLLTEADAREQVRCGVNLPGFDQVHPDDPRLPALVWSWREDDRGEDPGEACAAQGEDHRIGARACDESLPVACRTADGGWAVSKRSVAWAGIDDACTRAGHVGAGTPVNGWDSDQLGKAAVGLGDVWLAYSRVEGTWTVGGPQDDGRPTGLPDHPGPPADVGPPDHAARPEGAGTEHAAGAGGRPASSASVLPVAAMLVAILLAVGIGGGMLLRSEQVGRAR